MLSVLKTNFKIAALASVLLFALPLAAIAAKPVLYKGVITAYKLNIRERPSRISGVVIVLEQNDKVDVIEKKGGIGSWLKVRYKGKKGYIRNRPHYIRLVEIKKKPRVTQVSKETKKARKTSKKTPPKKAPPKKTIEKKVTQKKAIEKKIETQEKLVQTFSEKEMEIIEGLNEIDYALNRARIKAGQLAQDNLQLETRIQALHANRKELAAVIEINRGYTASRLKALYKMNMIGRLDAVGKPGSVFDFFLRQDSMKRIIAADVNVLEKQSVALKEFEILEKEYKNEMVTKTRLESELTDQIRINKKETLKREMILKEIRKKKKLSLAAVESLKNASLQLDNRINDFSGSQLSHVNTASFISHKGRLIRPVKGKVISRFGPSSTGDYKSFTFQKGIDIKVERGEPVKSVFKGEVMFAQWLKGYGNLLIINHGDNYYTLYAHVEEIFKKEGERVETGEVIATAGDTGSIKGMCLHFEVRHHGKPVNPTKWLRKGA